MNLIDVETYLAPYEKPQIRNPSTTGRRLLAGSRASGFSDATTSGIRSTQHGVDNGRRTPDTRLDGNGVERTVPAAGAALHAGVAILDLDMPGIHFKHLVRADIEAHSAAGAFVLIEFQCDHILQISQMIHL
jgi:hypothetical protein